MNRQCYRVIFNKARGMLMVVSEAAKSQTKAAGERSGAAASTASLLLKKPSELSVLTLSCLMVTAPLYSQIAQAADSQVSVDKTASLATRPTILAATNGTPIVNIRGTLADGISRNSFSQLDIQDNGVILNNSRFGADTQIGGHINGNFWLLFGEAKTIVNEVNSNKPTVFNGKLEVAGRAANVIIANPAGINVNGGTLINAPKGTLTTGKVNYTNIGGLDSITVNQGKVTIGEKGLNNQFEHGVNLTDILAKSVTLNGQITGNHQDLVQMVVGENTIKLNPELYAFDDTQIQPSNPDKAETGLALDIGQMGGAYANGIHIVGTKQGMGMSNAGILQATSFVRLNNNGRIENIGKIVATHDQTPNNKVIITNKVSDSDQGDIINKGVIQAGNAVVVQAGRDLSGDGQIIRNGVNGPNAEDGQLTLTAERNLQTSQLINSFNQGDIQLVAGSKLNIDQKADVTTSGHVLLSSGDNLTLNNAKLTSTGEGKSVQVYSGKDLTATNTSLNATNKDTTVSTAAQGNQTLTQVGLQADELYNQTGGKLTVNQADFTSRGKHDLAIVANAGIDANGLTATVNDGHLSLEAAKADLLQTPDSDIVINNATLKASQNVDIVADRHVSVANTNLQGNQIRSTAGNNLNLALTGNNQANTNVYLKAGDKLNLSTQSGKLDANHIEAMANRIEVGDQSKLTAKAGDIKLSSVGNPLAASDSNNAQDIKLGNQVDLTASNAIALAAQGAISATDLHANGGNSVAMVATKGIRLDSTDATRQNQLGSTAGDIALIDQGQDGVTATNLTINAAQGKARVQSLGDITLNTTQGSNAAIQTQAITITNVPATTVLDETTNKPHGKISIQDTDITANQGGILINSNDALTLARGNLNANGNLELHGNQATLLENVNANSQQHTAISSNTNLGISGSHITSKGILSAQGEQDTSLKDSQLQGGALLVAAKKGNLELGNNLTLATKATDLLGNDPKLAAINGSMTVKGNNDLVYDAGKTINADGDLDLRTTGKISFKGTPGNQGNGSETNVNVTAKGSIGMTGSSVEMLGTHVTSTDGGITIAATDGNIKIGAIENTIDGVKPENRLKELNDSLATVNHQLDTLNNDSLYQAAATAKKAAQDKLDKLIKDNAATPIADFEQQQQALKTEIAAQNTQLQQRTKALDINKTVEELTDEQADITRSLKIADTPYQGIEHAGSKLSAKQDVNLIATGGIAIEASDIDTRGKATLQSLSQLGEYRQVIDEKARADVLVPLMRLNKLSDGQKQDYLSQQLAAIDSMRFSLDDSVNQSEEMQKMRASLKELLPKAVAGDATAKAQIDKILTARAPVTIIPVAISIEGLNDIYERGKEGDKSYSLHNNNRPSNITADKGIVIQATGADNQDPKTVTTSGAPNNIIINSGTFTAKEGDIAISSVGNVILQAAQDSIYDAETQTSKKKSWGGLKKKVTITSTTEDIRNADPVTLIGNNVSVNAGDNIISYATDIKAPTGQVSLQAGDAIRLMAVDEVDNKNVDVKKTSSFIGIKYNKSHTNDTRNVSTELPSSLVANIIDTGSGDDTYLQGTEFEYLQGANIKAGVGMKAVPDAKIIFDTINTTVQENHTREFNNVVWQSMSEKGFVDETGTLPKFTGPSTPSFSAPGGLIVQVPLSEKEQADSTNLVNVVNRMGNQPGFEYLQEIAKRKDVDFSVVQTAQKEWDYKQEGLTPAAAALIALAVTIATGGSGAGVGANLLGTTTATGSAVANAAFASLASQASVTLINNKGDVAKTLRDLGKSETIKQIAFAAVTAGVSAKLDQTVLQGFNTDSLNDRFIRGIVNGTSNALVDSAINGTSLEESLKRSLRASIVDAGTGYVFTNAVKGLDSDALVDNIAHKLAAGLVGCASAQLNKQSCEAGALGAAVGEMVGDYLVGNPNKLSNDDKQQVINLSKIISGSVALVLGVDVNTAIHSAQIAVENNSIKECASYLDCTISVKKGVYRPTSMRKGVWQIIKIVDPNDPDEYLGYTAYNTVTHKTDFFIDTKDLVTFWNADVHLLNAIVGFRDIAETNPTYQNKAALAVMRGDLQSFKQAWVEALSTPSYYFYVATTATGGIATKPNSFYVYRKMSVEEANLTIKTGKLQPPAKSSNSSKYLSEDLQKVKNFQNKSVTEPQVIVEFKVDGIGYNKLMSSAVEQQGSKGVNAIKLNYEGITTPGLSNLGVPATKLDDFNKVIKGVKIIGQ